jgi:hypothetical protein
MSQKDEKRDALIAEITATPIEALRRELSEAGLYPVDPFNAYPEAAARLGGLHAPSPANDGAEAGGGRATPASAKAKRPAPTARQDVSLSLAAAPGSGGAPASSAEELVPPRGISLGDRFVAVAFTTDGSAALGYVRGAEDIVLVEGAENGEFLMLGLDTYELEPPGAGGYRVVRGLTYEGLGIWLVDAAAGRDHDPKIC